ncbi:Sulfotransferase family protein [Paracoccus isoporae]|uniref:Sulfotransferase family protein n=1 Tax=Paracoccus isoporae TaxID=591205 RepID=A0A1G7A856_9RHOB|nr:sulfotransferase family 2 domain-containing protein [Paracoccus isoporae]SDE10235.1 Sulfotransferase family protein [Paracoccus isoporae]
MADAQRILISVHVPKTGGTSFRHVLERLFGSGLLIDHPWTNRPAALRGDRLAGSEAEIRHALRGITCIHGHFDVRKYRPLLEMGGIAPVFMSWLRDPVERAVSTYYFLRSQSDSPMRDSDWERRAKSVSLEAFFADGVYGRNRQSGQLEGLDTQQYAFLGRTERYAESMEVFSHVFFGGQSLPEPPHRRRNTERTGANYDISPELRATLTEANAKDAALCRHADAWLDASLAAIRRGDAAAGPAQVDLREKSQVFPLLRSRLKRLRQRLA